MPADLIEHVLLGVRHQLTEGGFDVVVDVPSDLPLVRVARASMRWALDNLIDT